MESQKNRHSARLLRKSCAPAGARYQTFGRTVYDVPELLEAIAYEMSWASLVRLGNSSNYARRIVHRLIRERIRNHVDPFIPDPPNTFVTFFKFLKLTHGGIIGSLAWSVMDTNHEVMPINDLNIVVPNGGLRIWHWMEFLANIGYTAIYYRHDWGNRISTCRRTLTFHSAGRFITVTESKTSSITPVILSCALTSMMNVVTAHRIYCFFPTLFSMRTAQKCINAEYTATNMPGLARRGIHLQWATSIPYYTEACKEECNGIWRRTKGLPGVGIARWGGLEPDNETDISDAEEELGRTNKKFRIGYTCWNTLCPNFSENCNSYDMKRRRLR